MAKAKDELGELREWCEAWRSTVARMGFDFARGASFAYADVVSQIDRIRRARRKKGK